MLRTNNRIFKIAAAAAAAVFIFAVTAAFLHINAEVDGAEAYSFTRSFIKGDGDITSKFSLSKGGHKLTGLCRNGGPMSSSSGKATVKKLKKTDSRYMMAYYYGYKKGWTKGANGCDLARAFHYATYKTAYHQSAAKSKSMIKTAEAYAKEHGIPDNFAAYDCNPTDGSQEFIAWYYAPDGTMRLTKKSSENNVIKTGAYTFKGIQYKVYASKSINGKCYGTLTCTEGGSTNTIKLSPDGMEAKTYYVKEVRTNGCYKLSSSWYSVSIAPGKSKVVTVKDEPEYGSLSFTKVLTENSSKGSTVQGFSFTLTCRNCPEVKYTGVSDANGNVKIDNILLGTYTLTENLTANQLSQGYKQVSRSGAIVIGAGSNRLDISGNKYINERIPGDPELVILKETDDGGPVEGWEFTVTNMDTGELYTGLTDKSGRLTFKNVKSGVYKVEEKMTKAQLSRYIQPEPQVKTLQPGATDNLAFVFRNRAVNYPVKIKKVSEDGRIEGLEFTITGTVYPGTEYENKAVSVTGTTDINGYFDAGRLPPGEYVAEETGFDSRKYINQHHLEGYDKPAKRFTVKAGGVYIDGSIISDGEILFRNKPYSIHLIKTEVLADGTITDNPVKGAQYELYLLMNDTESLVGSYTTDSEGRLDIYDVTTGVYRFYETGVPGGYDDENERAPLEFRLDDSNNGSALVKDTNRQKYGSVFINKYDDNENPVEDSEFSLFTDEKCTETARDKDGNELVALTDKRGYILFEGLPWATYYIKETRAPRGYKLSEDIRRVEIGYDSDQDICVTDHEIHVINERKKGSVELCKTDMDNNIIEHQAVYTLYRNDGSMVKENLITGADNDGDGREDGKGKIIVRNLEWGSYYFMEKEAPAGYALSDEKVRFTVNALTGGRLQNIKAADRMLDTSVIATKKLAADDIYYDHGTPVFTFKLAGTDVGGTKREYHRNVTFSKEYIAAHTDDDGYVSISATFSDIPAGIYVLSEENVIRYEFERIEKNSVVGGRINRETVEFDLCNENVFGAAVFVNRKTDWRDYSDSSSMTNIVKSTKKYTALAAEYDGTVLEGNMPADNFSRYIKVYAVYDDGTERELEAGEYTVTDVDGNEFTRTPKVAGYYTISVAYTEDGITHADFVELQVAAAERVTVRFVTNGGSLLSDMLVWKYDTLPETTNDSSKYTPEKKYNNFSGWYYDEALTKAFDVINTKIMGDTILYARWDMRHLSEYSWSEIAEISESGNAAVILGECFDAVNRDLADGVLSSYEHTKAFVYDGKNIHAMMTGFGMDIDKSGNKTGISFMTYEPAGVAALNELDTNIGGWEASELRAELNSEIDNNITDKQLKDNLKEVRHLSGSKTASGNYSIVPTWDKLALPSQVELAGVYGFDTDMTAVDNPEYGILKSLYGEGTKYMLFNGIVPDGLQNSENALSRGYIYWTRSLAAGTSGFCTVQSDGAFGFD